MRQKNIFIAGHNGMVGAAIRKLLDCSPKHDVIVADRCDLDLTRQDQVEQFFVIIMLTRFILLQQRLVVFMETKPAQLISYAKIF